MLSAEEMKEKDVVLEDIIATKIKMMKELHELAVSREDISVQVCLQTLT